MGEKADLELSQRGEATLLAVRGSLDINNCEDLRATVVAIVDSKTTKVVVDLGRLRQIDSSGVGVLVSLFKRVGAAGGQVGFAHAQGQPLAVFRVLNMDRTLDIRDTVEDALKKVGAA